MATPLTTSLIASALPTNFVSGLIAATRATSVVAALSPSEPMQFGNSNILSLATRPRAEFVGEAAPKAATDLSLNSVQITPHKAQATVRISNEVEWANPQAALDIVGLIRAESAAALSEALDLGLIFRLNPLTGTQTAWTNYLNATTSRVEVDTAEADADLATAVSALQTANVAVNGLAMTGGFLAKLAALKNTAQGTPRYDLGFATTIDSFRGLKVAVSPTVKGFGADGVQLGTFNPKTEAIVGDWTNGIRWGIQKVVPSEVIQYGDPDGAGDLKRQNQVAIRMEIVYGWYVFTNRFAVIENVTPDTP